MRVSAGENISLPHLELMENFEKYQKALDILIEDSDVAQSKKTQTLQLKNDLKDLKDRLVKLGVYKDKKLNPGITKTEKIEVGILAVKFDDALEKLRALTVRLKLRLPPEGDSKRDAHEASLNNVMPQVIRLKDQYHLYDPAKDFIKKLTERAMSDEDLNKLSQSKKEIEDAQKKFDTIENTVNEHVKDRALTELAYETMAVQPKPEQLGAGQENEDGSH